MWDSVLQKKAHRCGEAWQQVGMVTGDGSRKLRIHQLSHKQEAERVNRMVGGFEPQSSPSVVYVLHQDHAS